MKCSPNWPEGMEMWLGQHDINISYSFGKACEQKPNSCLLGAWSEGGHEKIDSSE